MKQHSNNSIALVLKSERERRQDFVPGAQFAPGQMNDHPLNLRPYYRLLGQGYINCSGRYVMQGLVDRNKKHHCHGYNTGGCHDSTRPHVYEVTPFRCYDNVMNEFGGMGIHVRGELYGMLFPHLGWSNKTACAYVHSRGYGCMSVIQIHQRARLNRKRRDRGLSELSVKECQALGLIWC